MRVSREKEEHFFLLVFFCRISNSEWWPKNVKKINQQNKNRRWKKQRNVWALAQPHAIHLRIIHLCKNSLTKWDAKWRRKLYSSRQNEYNILKGFPFIFMRARECAERLTTVCMRVFVMRMQFTGKHMENEFCRRTTVWGILARTHYTLQSKPVRPHTSTYESQAHTNTRVAHGSYEPAIFLPSLHVIASYHRIVVGKTKTMNWICFVVSSRASLHARDQDIHLKKWFFYGLKAFRFGCVRLSSFTTVCGWWWP